MELLPIGRVCSLTELLYRIHVEEFKQHVQRLDDSTLWVSALVMCPRKWVFMRLYPEIAFSFRGYLALGRAVHVGIQETVRLYAKSLGWRRVEVEKEVEKCINVDLGSLPRIVRLRGKIDILAIDEEGNRIVVEIKSSRSDLNIPCEHHIQQLRIYMNLARANRGILLYLTPDRVAEYVYTEPISDEELQKLVASFLRMEGPRYPWECQHCNYAHLCPAKSVNVNRR